MKKSSSYNLAVLYPQLAAEWHPTKNGDNLPSDFAPKSNQYAWWQCKKCGYEWLAKINNRANGRGCACCARKIVVSGINDLGTTHPYLAAEWDYERNGELTPDKVLYGTRRRVYWLCSQGHSYKADINHRSASNGTNCPICNSGRQTSFAEQAVFYYVKKVFPDAISRYKKIFNNSMELDIYIPSIKLGIEYDGIAWHKNNNLEREKRKYKVCQENGIKLLRLRESKQEGCLSNADESISIHGNMYEHQELAKVIRFVLDRIDPASNIWTRRNPTHFHSSVDINIKRDENEIRTYMTVYKNNSLADLYPDIAKEWHPTKNVPLTPQKIKPGSDIRVWWLCPNCGNEYLASVSHRTRENAGCGLCGIVKSALKRSKKVKMIDLTTGNVVQTFASISDAGRKLNINSSNITSVCKKIRKQAGGFGWEYVDD